MKVMVKSCIKVWDSLEVSQQFVKSETCLVWSQEGWRHAVTKATRSLRVKTVLEDREMQHNIN